MKKVLSLLAVTVTLATLGFGPRPAYAEPISVDMGGNKFILPFQVVDGVQLYSLDEGRGYPAAQTVLVQRGDAQLSFGGAPILGTSENVPFVGLQVRLSEKFFDIGNNSLRFGAFVGWPSNQSKATYGILASVPLW